MSRPAIIIESERLSFRELTPEDAKGNYLKWMNDAEVVKYLESRFQTHTSESLAEFVRSTAASENNIFCAIVLKQDGRHIGNIKLGPIDLTHRKADVGLMIGEKDCWGKGLGSEAYTLMVEHAFKNLNLHKVTAGAYAVNEASIKALLKAGFRQEGLLQKHCAFDGGYTDVLLFGVLREEFERL